MRLKFTLFEGLVIVVPPGYDVAQVPSLLRRNQRWLARAQQVVEAQRNCYAVVPEITLPERLELRSIGEDWLLDYRGGSAAPAPVVEHAGRLLVFGGSANHEAVFTALARWLRHKARSRLVPWLGRLARQHGFEVQRVSVKSQRTRWASCSSAKCISLNLKLLFLPPELVEYTMLHELCHTLQLNHSSHFWDLVRRYDIDYLVKDQRLKTAWQFVPPWLENYG